MIRSRGFLLTAVVAVVALATGYGAGRWLRPAPPEPDTSQAAAIEFAFPDTAGKKRALSEWHGRPVLLNFWATWCAPCREEIPLLIAAQERYAAQGLQIIGVAIDSREAAAAYSAQFGITYPVLIGDDSALELMVRYGNQSGALPYTVLLSASGVIKARKIGAFRPAELDQTLTALQKSQDS